MPTAGNVTAGKPKATGAVFRAAKGTTLPNDATTSLAAVFKELGFVSEEGLTNSNSPTAETGKAWGGTVVIAYQEDRPDTFKLTLIEHLNIDAMKTVYGSANVSGATLAAGVSISVNNAEAEEGVWVFDMSLRGGVAKRIVVPSGIVTELGDIQYVDNDTVGYEITVLAMPDSSGNTHYEYIKAPTQ